MKRALPPGPRRSTAHRLGALGLVLALACPASATAQLYGESYAVVVGIDEYQASSWESLGCAKKDAEKLARFLEDQGFTVTQLYDAQASRVAILDSLGENLAPKVRPEDRVLFFFAGHGATEQQGEIQWAYIVPADGAGPSSYITMDDLRNASAKMRAARHHLFIVNSCFGGRLGTGAAETSLGAAAIRGVELAGPLPPGLRALASRPARQVIAAGGEDQSVRDCEPSGMSLFGEALLRGLEEGLADSNGDRYVAATELFSHLVDSASDRGQTPIYGVLPGHAGGDFLFRAPGNTGEAEPSRLDAPPADTFIALVRHPRKLRHEALRIDDEPLRVIDRRPTEALVELSFPHRQRSRVLRLGDRCSRVLTPKTDFTEPLALCQRSPWRFGGGVSFYSFEPELPAGLVTHDTHPEDRPFLAGDAGTTFLDAAEVAFLNLFLERVVAIGREGGVDLKLTYVLKLPLAFSGRSEKQNENDPRPSREGSFIFSELDAVDPAHEVGIGLAYETGRRLPITVEPAVYLGYWNLGFRKGWDRFGSDETALAAAAEGTSWSPQLLVRSEGRRLGASLTVAFRTIELDYGGDLGTSTTRGWEAHLALNMKWGGGS